MGEADGGVPVSAAAEAMIDQIPQLRRDPSKPDKDLGNLSANVLRGVILPLAMDHVQNGKATSGPVTIEALVASAIERHGSKLPPGMVDAVRTEYAQPREVQRDWRQDVISISRAGIGHPLTRLSQTIVEGSPVVGQAMATRAFRGE